MILSRLPLLRLAVTLGVFALTHPVLAQASDPLPDEVVNAIAQKTLQKFNNSSCQDLATSMAQHHQQQMSGQPPTLKDQLTARFVQRLRQDPQLAQAFFAQISTPVLTKLFECGLVPPQS
jgi:glucan biosynthesis protein